MTDPAFSATANTGPEHSGTPEVPNIRIVRHWHWVPMTGGELRFGGGPPPMQLEAIDVTEVLIQGQWTQVPIVELPKPEHPRVAEERRRQEAFSRSLDPQLVEQLAAKLRTRAGKTP